jgi:adenylate kinase
LPLAKERILLNIVFLGAPGAGKGTQAMRVAKKLQLAHIATGDLFRQAMQKGTAQGLKAKAFIEAGKLVPDEITIQMVLDRMAAPDCQVGVIFDGFPRNIYQAEALDKALGSQGKPIDSVVYIKVSEKVLLERLGGRWICRNCQTPYHAVYSPPKVAGKCDKCGGELYQRADDTTETIRKRLVVFAEETAPLIKYYTKTGKLVEVDGEGTEDAIEERIVETLRRGTAKAKSK